MKMIHGSNNRTPVPFPIAPFTSKDYTDIPMVRITVDSIKDGIQSITESIQSRVKSKVQLEIDTTKVMLALYGVFVLNAYGTVYIKVNDKKTEDIPDRFKGERPKKGESGKDAAKRVLEKRGEYDPKDTGPRSDFKKLKKYFDTHFE